MSGVSHAVDAVRISPERMMKSIKQGETVILYISIRVFWGWLEWGLLVFQA